VATPRDLPAVHALLADPAVAEASATAGHAIVAAAAREVLHEARQEALAGVVPPDSQTLATAVIERVGAWLAPRPRPVINATGVILHTNLGRAPVSAAAAEAMRAVALGYSDLEYDRARGTRGSRDDVAGPLLCRLTGAEAALVVNNNAGATLLILSSLAAGRDAIVSRGQLVEIGGGYRIPTIMAASGATLVEVGTTNRTHAADYRAAIGDATALVLRVHASNFRIVGFASDVPLDELVAIAHGGDVLLVDDLGSGSLLDTRQFGLPPEPMVTDSVAAGADVICFSGDKLLGGPQAGIIVGRKNLVQRLKSSPLARALRADKCTLAGLHATLVHYARGEATTSIPVWRMIAARPDDLRSRAATWRSRLEAAGHSARLIEGQSAVGGGSLPGETMPTALLVVEGVAEAAVDRALRLGPVPVVPRLAAGSVVLDARTVLPEQDEPLLAALLDALRVAAQP
jgi:L-seryl-tRNA(Ser) seleniumtransferase